MRISEHRTLRVVVVQVVAVQETDGRLETLPHPEDEPPETVPQLNEDTDVVMPQVDEGGETRPPDDDDRQFPMQGEEFVSACSSDDGLTLHASSTRRTLYACRVPRPCIHPSH